MKSLLGEYDDHINLIRTIYKLHMIDNIQTTHTKMYVLDFLICVCMCSYVCTIASAYVCVCERERQRQRGREGRYRNMSINYKFSSKLRQN